MMQPRTRISADKYSSPIEPACGLVPDSFPKYFSHQQGKAFFTSEKQRCGCCGWGRTKGGIHLNEIKVGPEKK